MSASLGGCDRGVSSPLGYILNLSIAALVLVSIGAMGALFVDAHASTTVEEDLQTHGYTLAGDLQEVDRRLAQAAGDGTLGVRSSLADRVRGEGYVVEVINESDAQQNASPTPEIDHADQCERSCLVLVTRDGETRTTVNFVVSSTVSSARLVGGTIYVEGNPTEETIQVQRVESR